MCDVFISHIHEDEKIANAVSRFLLDRMSQRLTSSQSTQAIKVFLSENEFQVRLGDDWLKKIHDALNSAKVVIALFSSNALQRPWIHFEAGGAWFAQKSLMPVCLGSLDPARLPKPYSNIQGCNLHEDGAPYYLYQSVHHALFPRSICLPPWVTGHDEEQTLKQALSDWTASQAPSAS